MILSTFCILMDRIFLAIIGSDQTNFGVDAVTSVTFAVANIGSIILMQ